MIDKNGKELKINDYVLFPVHRAQPSPWLPHTYGIIHHIMGLKEERVFIMIPKSKYDKSKTLYLVLASRLELMNEDEVIIKKLTGNI